jgi:small subunit ribosomal protein S6
MREYEMIVILHPDLDETAFKDILDRISGWITQDGGEITKTDLWGKRTLAYPIRKQREGQYVLMNTKMNPQLGAVLERNLRYIESVLRYLIIAK